jgi:ribosomal protein S18 acetylase RimI-like enzyme
MREAIQIRPAQPADAEVAAVLLYAAYTHTQVSFPLPEAHAHPWIQHLQLYFGQGGNRFSYQNASVADPDSEVIGLVLSFGGRDEARLNAPVGPWLEREAHDDEWYVDALAVLTNWGRKGIGKRLMQTAEQQAREGRYPKIALHVAVGNKPALELYTHLGFVAKKRTTLYQRRYVRMVKELDPTKPASS